MSLLFLRFDEGQTASMGGQYTLLCYSEQSHQTVKLKRKSVYKLMMCGYFKAEALQIKVGRRKLVKRLYTAKNFFTQAHGLMFRTLQDKEGMYFDFGKERIIDIHMFFVFKSLDILFLKEKKVVAIRRELKPFALTNSKYCCDAILELKAKSAKNVKIGDVLQFSHET